MLTIFRRHTKACKESHGNKDMGREYRKCNCPISTEGTLSGKMIRKALDTGSWARAQAIVRDREAVGKWEEEAVAVDAVPVIAEAMHTFLSSLTTKSAGRAKGTVRGMHSILDTTDAKYKGKCQARADKEGRGARAINMGLVEYCKHVGVTKLDALTLPFLTQWAATWECGALQRSKRIQLVRRFFRFAIACEWVKNNPGMGMEHPKGRAIKGKAKLPYDANVLPGDGGAEWKAIVGYCSTRPKLWALVAIMRYTGLRISDASTFNTSRVMEDGSIMLQMSKTGGAVTVPMHPKIKEALAQITPNSDGYYFCSGQAQIATSTDNWRVRLVEMFKACGIVGGHAHRFRHTFAVDLLLRGVPLDQVSQLLGHHSSKITEKHYISFVSARRAQLRDSVLAAWAVPTAPVPPPATPIQAVPIEPTPSQGRRIAIVRKEEAA